MQTRKQVRKREIKVNDGQTSAHPITDAVLGAVYLERERSLDNKTPNVSVRRPRLINYEIDKLITTGTVELDKNHDVYLMRSQQ